MKQITREWLAFLREQYPVGSRIRLNSMEDPYAPVEPGTMGTLQRIDDAGQFLMKWDNGRTLSLIPGEDSFSLILPEPTMMKLYMPLHADLYTKDDWSDTSEEPEMLTGRALMEYEDSILIALMREWLGTSEVDLSVFDLQDLNFRLKKLPRIFRDLYEYDYPPTKHSIDLLDRKYCKTN